jgi:hypothetical protein
MEFVLVYLFVILPLGFLVGRTFALSIGGKKDVEFWTDSAEFWRSRAGNEQLAAHSQAQADFYAMPWYKKAITPMVKSSDYGC